MDFTNTAKLIVSAIYYIIVALLALFSLFGVYILLRYGRTLPITTLISVMYTIFFITAALSSYASLQAILNL